MIGLSQASIAAGVGLVAGVVSRAVAEQFVKADAPSSATFIALQLAVVISSGLIVQANSLAASLVLGFSLALLAMTDALVLRLPDILTIPLGAAGLVLTVISAPADFVDHAIGAAAGYAVLALAASAYARTRSSEGLGMGDAKLLACAGAWLGWRPLPLVVLAAALGGIAWVIAARLRRGASAWREPAPFGVPLALATWVAWLVAAAGTSL